jgi:hypothetical protein
MASTNGIKRFDAGAFKRKLRRAHGGVLAIPAAERDLESNWKYTPGTLKGAFVETGNGNLAEKGRQEGKRCRGWVECEKKARSA